MYGDEHAGAPQRCRWGCAGGSCHRFGFWAHLSYSAAHEAYVPAKEAKARQGARLSFSHKDRRWSQNSCPPSRQGPQPFVGVGLDSMPPRSRLTRVELEQMAALRPSVAHGRYVTVVSSSLPGLKAAKVACVVSKKVSVRAVDRNKVQRRLREISRGPVRASAKPLALVIRAKKEALGAAMSALRADLEPLLARILG